MAKDFIELEIVVEKDSQKGVLIGKVCSSLHARLYALCYLISEGTSFKFAVYGLHSPIALSLIVKT